MKNVLYITIFSLFLFLNLSAQSRKLEGIKREALLHMQNGRYGDAIDLLNKFISADPRYPEGYYLRGLCWENRKQYFNAVIDYRRALKLDPSFKEARIAHQRTIEKWYEILLKEIQGYKREIAINPQDPFNYLEIGKRYRWMEEWEMAERWYDKYLARDKNASPDEIIRYTIILTKTRHIYKGWKILGVYVKRFPDDWRLWSRYGYFSLWLGKNKLAEKAFLKALSFKPFFQEALDGLDLARRKGYVTLYQQNYDRVKQKEYPIDRDYRILKNNPDKDDVRFRLVEELTQVKRFEEAYQQLLILKDKHENEAYFQQLWDDVTKKRLAYYENKISEELSILQQDSSNGKALRNVAQYYSNLEAYNTAEELLGKYVASNPQDYETRYVYAKVLSLDGKFEEALNQIDTVLTYNSIDPRYNLLAGQLNVWINRDLNVAENYLSKVLSAQPKNVTALIAMGTLYFQKDSISLAQQFAQKAEAIQPDNPELKELKSMIDLELVRQKEQEYLLRLNKGRKLVKKGDCENAIPYYEDYIRKYPNNDNIKLELADVYLCAKRFSEALDIYDSLLAESYDISIEKRKAKALFWEGDTSESLALLQKLYAQDPDDMEIELYLGDAYARVQNYKMAQEIYYDLKNKAPKSYIIEQRINWLPPEYRRKSFLGKAWEILNTYLFSYMVLSPVASYFKDNLGFEYYFGGLGGEIGFTKYFSLGASWYKGNIANYYTKIPFTVFKGTLFFHPSKKIMISGSYGKMVSPGIIDQPVYEGNLKYVPLKNLNIALNYLHSDGSVVLYSYDLVTRRIPANNILFDASYKTRSRLLLGVNYSFVWTEKNIYEKNNFGNMLGIRLGKAFRPYLSFGYEYYFSDFYLDSKYYYCPQSFVSHSLWGEWEVFKTKEWLFRLKGKLGYVPRSNYVVRNIQAEARYSILKNLYASATAFLGSSIRKTVAYSSGSFYITLFWTVY